MDIKVHSSPGRGLKQCPFCNKYVGVRNPVCACGHKFDPNYVPDTTESKVYNGPGKGRKQCVCGKYVGIRTAVCECGHVFYEKIERPEKIRKELVLYDEGGKGRKQCASCEKYIWIFAPKCLCGSEEFISKIVVKESKELVLYDEGGKGRKQCASCEKYIWAGAQKCLCGSEEFVLKAVKEAKEIEVYDEGGPGRKECEQCHKFIWAGAKVCNCGSESFVKKAKEEPVIKTYTDNGPKRKQCVCGLFLGYSAKKCSCGHEFTEAEIPSDGKVRATIQEFDSDGNRFTSTIEIFPPRGDGSARLTANALGAEKITWIASGVCPHKLKGTSFDDIQDWVQVLRDKFAAEDNTFLALSALRYWIRYGKHSVITDDKVMRDVLNALNEILPEEAYANV